MLPLDGGVREASVFERPPQMAVLWPEWLSS